MILLRDLLSDEQLQKLELLKEDLYPTDLKTRLAEFDPKRNYAKLHLVSDLLRDLGDYSGSKDVTPRTYKAYVVRVLKGFKDDKNFLKLKKILS